MESSTNEWSTASCTVAFLAAIAAVAGVVTFLRWPASTGNVHWSEWFAHYFFPPFFFAGLFAAIPYAIQRRQVKKGTKSRVRLPLVGLWFWVLAFEALGFVGAARGAVRSPRIHASATLGERSVNVMSPEKLFTVNVRRGSPRIRRPRPTSCG